MTIIRHRQTSILTYRQIEAEGLLSKMRWKVYKHLYNNGPLTAGELTYELKRPDEPHPSYHRRLDELEQLGVAYRRATRKCRITGRLVEEWDVTDKLPSGKIENNKNPRPSKQAFINALHELVAIRDQVEHPYSQDLLDVLVWLKKRYT